VLQFERTRSIRANFSFWEDVMLRKCSLVAVVAAELVLTIGTAGAFDDAKYPDWSGQWRRPQGVGTQWDQTKPAGLPQKAPLTPEYQARLEASIADQARGGQGDDPRVSCITAGMPRIMTGTRPFELVVLPEVTYVYGEGNMPRRIYTDGRSFPADEEPTFMGYSVGKWIDDNHDGKYDVLEVETRSFKGPRTYEFSGILLHDDNASVIKERFFLDKANANLLHIEITAIDHALTRPWTVLKTFRREPKVLWAEYDCAESNNHVVVGKEYYFLSGDGYLMPTRKDQPPPDPRYFKTAK
jgi:hypothetical protein